MGRRAHPRTPCEKTIDVLPCKATPNWKFLQAQLIDCSLNGLSLVLQEAIEVGQQFLVKLHVDGRMTLLIYTVRNCVDCSQSLYRIGAEFSGFAAEGSETRDPEAVLRALIAS